MDFITSNALIIAVFITIVLLSAILYYFYKKKKKVFVEEKTDFYKELGLTEESGAINEHFQFPESKDSMSDEVFNKFKTQQAKEENSDDSSEDSENQEEVEVLKNELDKLRKDYKETSEDIKRKSERSFSIDLENGTISHEILKKRNKKP